MITFCFSHLRPLAFGESTSLLRGRDVLPEARFRGVSSLNFFFFLYDDVVSFEQCGIPFSLSEDEPQVVQHSLHRASADRRHVHVRVADHVVV